MPHRARWIAWMVLAGAPLGAQPPVTVRMTPAEGDFEVGSTHDFTVTLQVREELAPGSQLRVLTPRNRGWSKPSLTPPQKKEPGYGLVAWQVRTVDGRQPALKVSAEKWSDRGPPYTVQDRVSQVLFKVDQAALKPGDAIAVRFPACRVTTAAYHPNPDRRTAGYRVQVKPAGADQWTEVAGCPTYRIHPAAPNRLHMLGPSQVVVGEPFTAALTVMDRFRNPTPFVGGVRILCSGPVGCERDVAFTAQDKGVQRVRHLRLSRPGTYVVTAASEGLRPASIQVEVLPERPSLRLYWGELHSHGALSYDARNWGGCTMHPADMFAYARDIERLDFAAITDHSMHNARLRQQNMTEEQFCEIQQAARQCNREGEFITFTAVEQRCARGDTNVFFLDDDAPYYMRDGPKTIQQLWRIYRDREIFTIPHLHPLKKDQTRFDRIDPDKERAIEIHSNHGRYEYHDNRPLFPRKGMVPGNNVQSILARGHRLGIVAASDDHSGRPGSSDVTGVYAPRLTRRAIFDAIRARHTFGTTGARINLTFGMGANMMGDDVRVRDGSELWVARRFHARVLGTGKLQTVELIRNGRVIYHAAPGKPVFELEYADREPLRDTWLGTEKNNLPTTYYYLRVLQQTPPHPGRPPIDMAWSSPIFLSPAR